MAGKGKKSKTDAAESRDQQLQELASAVAALREEMARLPLRGGAPARTETAGGDELSAITVRVAGADAATPDRVLVAAIGRDELAGAAAEVARLGGAFDTPAKVELVRALLEGGTLGATALSAASGLTTGSLYHHLRDLIHAGVVETSEKNRYRLTHRGRHAAGALFALTRI